MKIAFLTREFKDNSYDYYIRGIPLNYLKLVENDALPIYIDSSLSLDSHKNEIISLLKTCDGVIIPGGNTISLVDLFVIDYCYKHDIPLLGICLGMQEIAYYFDNDSLSPISAGNHFDLKAKYLHEIKILPNTYLSKLLNQNKISVNSRHKYKIKENSHYQIEALSLNDNIIEAIKVKNVTYMLGVQFHPEIMLAYQDKNARAIIDSFIKASRQSKENHLS